MPRRRPRVGASGEVVADGLTPAQERFCQEYLLDLNATRAYAAAYPQVKETTARANGSRLLARANVAARIQTLQQERRDRLQIDADYVLSRLQQNVERAMEAVPVLDDEGHPTGVYRYEGAVANGALKLLGQHLGLFVEKHEVDHRFIAEVPAKAPSTAAWVQQQPPPPR